MDYNPDHPGSPLPRTSDYGPRRKKDRQPVIRYGPRGTPRSGRFTTGEMWLIDADHTSDRGRYLLGSVDDTDKASTPLDQRASLARLMAIAVTWSADILVEGNSVSSDVVAVLAEHVGRHEDQRLIYTLDKSTRPRRHPAGRKYLEGLKARMDDHERVRVHDALQSLATLRWWDAHQAAPRVESLLMSLLGSEDQPPRNVQRARLAAESLQGSRWPNKSIQWHLGLYGFENPSGTLGVWNHANFQALMSAPKPKSSNGLGASPAEID